MDEGLDQLVRRVDEDRWLASRFAPKDVRSRLIAIYALNDEIARASEGAKQLALGDIRLAWWREAITEIHQRKPARAHPVLAAFAESFGQAQTPIEPWLALLEARSRDLDSAAFSDWVAFDAYVDATAGSVMRLAFSASRASASSHEGFITAAARAWGAVSLGRAGRLPNGETLEAMAARALAAHRDARERARSVPAGAFPAMGYVALVPSYLRALKRRQRKLLLLPRQFRLIAAAATGAI
jgi:phytoene synthase